MTYFCDNEIDSYGVYSDLKWDKLEDPQLPFCVSENILNGGNLIAVDIMV